MQRVAFRAVLGGFVALSIPGAARSGEDAPGWSAAERAWFGEPVPLTSDERFARAGEAYFSPDGGWIIFQAIERGADGGPASAHYAMYVAPIRFDAAGRALGLGETTRLSPEGSANTCGFFDPTDRTRVIFGSTITAPAGREGSGYRRGSRDYVWRFPEEMEVVRVELSGMETGAVRATTPTPLWKRDGYDAECAFSPDGRWIVHTRVDAQGDGDLWVHDTESGDSTALVETEGYDGGPFFSPDGKWICYRSDRRGDDLLQLFVAELAFDAQGRITGIEREIQLTDDRHVNWAPFWTADGGALLFTSSRAGHDNYEVYAIDVATRAVERVTHAPGFDGLPALSPDGRFVMWTSQRQSALTEGAAKSSQIWLAALVARD